MKVLGSCEVHSKKCMCSMGSLWVAGMLKPCLCILWTPIRCSQPRARKVDVLMLFATLRNHVTKQVLPWGIALSLRGWEEWKGAWCTTLPWVSNMPPRPNTLACIPPAIWDERQHAPTPATPSYKASSSDFLPVQTGLSSRQVFYLMTNYKDQCRSVKVGPSMQI